jgi:5'-nucleotidase
MILSDEAQQKIEAIKTAGKDKLHIVADFDRTLTYHQINGEKTSTSFAQLRNGGHLGDDYTEKAEALYDHYRPIEEDSSLSEDERNAAMYEWWGKHLNLILSFGLSKHVFEEISDSGTVMLRDKADEFFRIAEANDIPFLILSAGLGDIIKTHLNDKQLITPNVRVVSNFFEFNGEGEAIGVNEPFIHVGNKDESGVAESDYKKKVDARNYCIVMGDKIDDLKMSHGLDHELELTIGFLNGRTDKLEAFKEAFDIVIEEDGDMTEVNELLRNLVNAAV